MKVFKPPFYAEDVTTGLPVLIWAMEIGGSGAVFLTVDIDGLVRVQRETDIRMDWRYDLNKKEWYDHSFLGVEEEEA